MSKRLDLVDQKFGRLIAKSFSHTDKGYTYWNCICECGSELKIKGSYLTSKTKPTKSCGCLVKEVSPKNLPKDKNIKHNMSRTKLYNVWNTMIMRCNNPKSTSYSRYGGRGIKVCDKWRKFSGFYEDMFSTYKEGLTIDRENSNGDYCKENCRWVNEVTQANNRRSNHYIEYKDNKYTLSELAKKVNVPYDTLKRRVYKGWSITKAVETPVGGGKKNDTILRK